MDACNHVGLWRKQTDPMAAELLVRLPTENHLLPHVELLPLLLLLRALGEKRAFGGVLHPLSVPGGEEKGGLRAVTPLLGRGCSFPLWGFCRRSSGAAASPPALPSVLWVVGFVAFLHTKLGRKNKPTNKALGKMRFPV